jgi:transaldolase
MPWPGRRYDDDADGVRRELRAMHATIVRLTAAVERLAAASVATLPPELAAALAEQAVEAAKLKSEVHENQPPLPPSQGVTP